MNLEIKTVNFYYSAQVNSFAYFWAYAVHIKNYWPEKKSTYFCLSDPVKAQSHFYNEITIFGLIFCLQRP